MRSIDETICRTLKLLGSGEHYDISGLRTSAPPPAASTISAFEERFGLILPELFRRLYLEVSNGGIGPGYGLIGFDGGVRDDEGRTLPEVYQSFLNWSEEMGACPWPSGLIPIAHEGCGIYSCLATNTASFEIVVWDHHNWSETPETWNECFTTVSSSIGEWWNVWLDEMTRRLEMHKRHAANKRMEGNC